MNIQPKARSLSISLGRNTRKQTQPAADGPSPMMGSSLQSLAAELHQAAVQGVFEYPRNVVVVAKVFTTLLAAMPFLVVAVLAIRTFQATNTFSSLVNWQIAGSALGAVIGLAGAAFFSNLFPTIQVTPQGMAVSGMFGKRRIPWKQIGTLRVMEARTSGRYVVMVPFEGATPSAPMSSLVLSLAGAAHRSEKGVLFTSDIKGFERLLQLIVAYVSQEAGAEVPIEAFVDETVVLPGAQLIFDANGALNRMSLTAEAADAYGIHKVDDGPQISWKRAISRQLLISTPPALFLLMSILIPSNERYLLSAMTLWLAVMLLLGVLELPFIAKLVQSVGDLTVGGGQFRRSVKAYEELQVPRALLIMLGVAFLAMGVPPQVAQGLWLIGMLITTILTTSFVRRLYGIPIAPTLIASVGTFVYQVFLFALYFGLR